MANFHYLLGIFFGEQLQTFYFMVIHFSLLVHPHTILMYPGVHHSPSSETREFMIKISWRTLAE